MADAVEYIAVAYYFYNKEGYKYGLFEKREVMRNKAIDLKTLAANLDISPTMYQYTVDRYNGISEHLKQR